MALTDLRTSIGTATSADTFNTLISNYPDVAEVLSATFTSGQTYAYFTVFNQVEFMSGISQNYSSGAWSTTMSCYIDEDNKIFVMGTDTLCYMVLFYDSSEHYLVAPYCANPISGATTPYAVYDGEVVALSISTIGAPSIVNNTFSGYYFYSEDIVFKKVVHYMTTPTTLIGTNIQTPTKDILLITNATRYTYVGACIAIALDL